MTRQRFGVSFANLGMLVGVLCIATGACSRVESDDNGGGGGSGGGNTSATTGAATGGAGATVNNATSAAVAKGGGETTSPSGVGSSTANGGNASATTVTSIASGNATACVGLPPSANATDATSLAAACNGATVEAEPLPVDMIILMDRSISNSYAVGSETATPAAPGERTRWQVLTAAMQALATDPSAASIGASITFFSLNDESKNCTEALYETPVVPLGMLSTTGPQIVAAMNSLTPAGLTPTVPALTGALRYAMAEKQKDSSREKVVVMISDGFPTECDQKSPTDVTDVIKEAAAAAIPIRTFIIGVGSPDTMDSAKFNLINYARAGNTGKSPYVLDETAGADQVGSALVNALLNISGSNLACDYGVEPPDATMVVDPDKVMFTYQPNAGSLQEIPKVSSAAACNTSAHGGWYFDNPAAPTKLTLCPCSCANLGAGKANLYYGCKPQLVYN
jgi:hypothetical protein